MGLLVNIDNGGTLTDICAFDGNRIIHAKTLTTPHDLTECLMEGLAALAQKTEAQGDILRLVASIDHLRYSTTQGTNAIVQRKGPRLGLLTSKTGVVDGLQNASPELFATLIGDRHAILTDASDHQVVQSVRKLIAEGASRLVICMDGAEASTEEGRLRRLLYNAFPRHLLGAVPLLFSSDLAPGADTMRRGWSALLNAFLHPSMEQFLHHAEDRLRRSHSRNPLLVFRNDGGSTRVSRTVALHTYSSGPRGGAVGAGILADAYGYDSVVSIDIGGTTTDLALFKEGSVAERAQGNVEGAPTPFPMADVSSIAAGGGSVLTVVRGSIQVGPDSVGALPGPACFGRGGTSATITDVMLIAGIVDPKSFFGGRLTLDKLRAEKAVREHIADPLGLPMDRALTVAIDAYDAKVAAAISSIATEHPLDALLAFGGAGPMSACGIAEQASINTVLVPRYAAVFSAFGIGFSPIRHSHSSDIIALSESTIGKVKVDLVNKAARAMTSEGFDLADCTLEWTSVNGDDKTMVPLGELAPDTQGRLVLNVVRPIPTLMLEAPDSGSTHRPEPHDQRDAFGGIPLFCLEELRPGATAAGPCLVEEQFFTTWVRQGWRFTVTGNHDLLLQRERV